jgi:hypothetical protein
MRRLLYRLALGNSKVELHQRLQSAEPEWLLLRHFNHGFSLRRHNAQQASIKAASSSAFGRTIFQEQSDSKVEYIHDSQAQKSYR